MRLSTGGQGRHPRARTKMAVVHNGKPAVTHYRVLERFPRHTLLECRLETGRTHQIRVHLASEGFPIAGDVKYGNFEFNKTLLRSTNTPSLKRMFLHAWRLQINHPVSGERIELLAPLPSDLEAFANHAAPCKS